MKLELYYYDQCPFCQVVLRKISELGINQFISLKNTLINPENASYHLDSTGRASVPCLYIDSKPMFESADIANWLANNSDQIKKLS